MGDEFQCAEMVGTYLEAGLGDGIEYVRPVSGAQKWDLLKKAHVLALPTFYGPEAQPISLIEGMAFG